MKKKMRVTPLQQIGHQRQQTCPMETSIAPCKLLQFYTDQTVQFDVGIQHSYNKYTTENRLRQKIPKISYCDGEVDCKDGTDEINCTCSDILRSYNSSLICDGTIHCHDSSDEINCLGKIISCLLRNG